MSTVVVATVKSNSSSPPAFQNTSGTEIGTLCRAWVNFNGTGVVAIRADFNVSSITDNGTGNYSVNFTTAMADANYSAVATTRKNDDSAGFAIAHSRLSSTYTSSAFQVLTTYDNSVLSDMPVVAVAIFR